MAAVPARGWRGRAASGGCWFAGWVAHSSRCMVHDARPLTAAVPQPVGRIRPLRHDGVAKRLSHLDDGACRGRGEEESQGGWSAGARPCTMLPAGRLPSSHHGLPRAPSWPKTSAPTDVGADEQDHNPGFAPQPQPEAAHRKGELLKVSGPCGHRAIQQQLAREDCGGAATAGGRDAAMCMRGTDAGAHRAQPACASRSRRPRPACAALCTHRLRAPQRR